MSEPTFLVIWKYELFISDYIHHVKIPKGATFLSADIQNGQPQMWWLVNPEAGVRELRGFRIVGTGHPTIREGRDKHLATFQQPPFVWHLFEVEGGLDGTA